MHTYIDFGQASKVFRSLKPMALNDTYTRCAKLYGEALRENVGDTHKNRFVEFVKSRYI